MSVSKLFNTAPFFFFLIFLIMSLHSYLEHQAIAIVSCPENETQALLALKQSFSDPSHRLLSWSYGKASDCCTWRGVVCKNLSGGAHVHQLRLGGYDLTGKLNPSLLNLTYLAYLDLSSNNFSGETMPSFFGSFTTLEYLNLSDSNFDGTIPQTIGNLSNLIALSLKGGDGLIVDNLEWLCGLHQLEYLNLNSVNLSAATNWVQLINKLPSLKELHLRRCDLSFLGPLDVVNITSLSTLDLSWNHFHSLIPKWTFQLTNLIHLNFSSNSLHDTISSDFGNLSSLIYLDLSYNDLSGTMPREISNLNKMLHLDLSVNGLHGEIPYSIRNMSNLEFLGLRTNQLGGALPTSLATLFNLEELHIDHNKLSGIVTENHLMNLTNLKSFVASGNHLTLKVKQDWIPPFQLQYLGLGSWNLGPNGQFPTWLETWKDMRYLDLSNTGISGTIPSWIWNVRRLDLSYNNLHGKIPDTIGVVDAIEWSYVSLCSNRFSGLLPRVSHALWELDLSYNSFTGGISQVLCGTGNATYSMEALILDENQLRGELPDCWMNWPSLKLLSLGNNNFSGTIPNSIGNTSLKILKLYNNKFSGQIPHSLLNCKSLAHMDLANNNLDGNIPSSMGRELPNLAILILQSNKLSGNIPLELCHLEDLQILDLSDNLFFGVIPGCFHNFTKMVKRRNLDRALFFEFSVFYVDSVSITTKGRISSYDTFGALVTHIDVSKNNLSGEIPREFTRLAELRFLNLSGNHLTGTIPYDIGNMSQLESLDLSRNSLSGGIPDSFTTMSFLSNLNLSFNHFTGKIPESTQLRGMGPSIFEGNHLCGPPLPSHCSYTRGRLPKSKHNDEREDDKIEVQWLYMFACLGYFVGLAAACSVLILKKSWRVALFAIVEDMWDAIYVYFYIN